MQRGGDYCRVGIIWVIKPLIIPLYSGCFLRGVSSLYALCAVVLAVYCRSSLSLLLHFIYANLKEEKRKAKLKNWGCTVELETATSLTVRANDVNVVWCTFDAVTMWGRYWIDILVMLYITALQQKAIHYCHGVTFLTHYSQHRALTSVDVPTVIIQCKIMRLHFLHISSDVHIYEFCLPARLLVW